MKSLSTPSCCSKTENVFVYAMKVNDFQCHWLSMYGQKLRYFSKYLFAFQSYRFRRTWGWVNCRFLVFVWSTVLRTVNLQYRIKCVEIVQSYYEKLSSTSSSPLLAEDALWILCTATRTLSWCFTALHSLLSTLIYNIYIWKSTFSAPNIVPRCESLQGCICMCNSMLWVLMTFRKGEITALWMYIRHQCWLFQCHIEKHLTCLRLIKKIQLRCFVWKLHSPNMSIKGQVTF